MHGARLHGFALLVSLGDRQRAARAAAGALAQGARRNAELQHPERAAAWLRASALKSLRRLSSQRNAAAEGERRAVLRELEVADVVYAGLAALPIRERAALIATAIERFDPMDVDTILDMAVGSGRRLASRARERYLLAVAGSVLPEDLNPLPGGELAERVRVAAARAMGPVEGARR